MSKINQQIVPLLTFFYSSTTWGQVMLQKMSGGIKRFTLKSLKLCHK